MNQVEHLIEIHDISKNYESGDTSINAIKNMNFYIDDGEFITIMGQSGSGKSTLLSVLGALNHPSFGKVLIDSMDLYNLSTEQRADFRSEYIGFIFQSFQLVPYLTVIENVEIPMAVTGIKKKNQREMAMDVLKIVGLEQKSDRLPDQLSGGEQERVAIARAIVNKPPLILADEPTGNLDSNTATGIMELLKSLNKDGHTIIMVTHNQKMSEYASRTINIVDGEAFA
ncbi:MAG: ABC transporter ATP-binding protein [Deltaproteobacteria bacterium]|jgi:putative ABC transport system ATP-binding protein|nr:ABC transporter ATP-binding protein [Deltaproteobacteria bacterium]